MDRDKLGRELVAAEQFDLALYRKLRAISDGEMAALLDELIVVETRHYRFWREFFGRSKERIGFVESLRLSSFVWFCRLTGDAGISLLLEAIEINGVRKYLSVWEQYQDEQLGEVVKEILDDELKHEDAIVSDKIKRRIHPEHIRDIFLGLNDGLVEILGSVSGFFIAFHSVPAVLTASFTVSVAGAFSMAAGAYIAVGSEREAEDLERGKQAYLEGKIGTTEPIHPFSSAAMVGVSYLVGAAIPIVPVFFGAENIALSLLVSAIAIAIVSSLLAFLSGMDSMRRIKTNLCIIALAVGVTALIGMVARQFLGMNV